MVAIGGPVILLYMLYMPSVGLAWAFGKKRSADADERPSQQALLFFVTADWLRSKAAQLLLTKVPAAKALKS